MSTLNNIKIGTKLILGYVFLAVLLIVVAVAGYLGISLSAQADQIAIKHTQDVAVMQNLKSLVFELDIAQVDLMIKNDSAEAETFRQVASELKAEIKKVQDFSDTPSEKQWILELAEAEQNFEKHFFDKMVPAQKSGDLELFMRLDDEGDIYVVTMETLSDKLIGAFQDDIGNSAVVSAQTETSTYWTLFIVSLVAVIISLFMGIILSRSITNPLQRVVAMIQEMKLGHLGNRLNLERKDEIGVLAGAMDLFAADLQNLVVATLKKIADGDLSTDVVKKDERDEIGPALIQITTSLRGLVAETNILTRAGADGKLSVRGDATKFKGGYHEIVLGLNNTLDAVIGPLNAAADYMDKIAGGVVPAPIVDTYRGDFNTLKNNLNRMSDRLREMLTSISEAANNLTSATAEILAATTQQASGASEQSAAISQTTTTVEEVKASAEQAAMRAQDVATASQRTVEVARSGQGSVQATIESMAMIKERVEGISENLLALSDQTQQIGEIISTVNEIASQSNMLALNASVEAARAGEHGKGFAVVATEVRSLAEQSRQATEQIKAILSEIQKATNSTVMATEEGVKGVDRGVQLSTQSRESIEQLAAVINESAQVAAQVVASGQQQQTGIDQISLAMQNINQVTMQSLASTRQTEKSAQSLNELARRMSEILAQYKF